MVEEVRQGHYLRKCPSAAQQAKSWQTMVDVVYAPAEERPHQVVTTMTPSNAKALIFKLRQAWVRGKHDASLTR